MSKAERTFRLFTIAIGIILIAALMVAAGVQSGKGASKAIVTNVECVIMDAPPVLLEPHVVAWTKEKYGETLVMTQEERELSSSLFQLVTAPQAFINEECDTLTLVGLYTQSEETLGEAYAYTGFLILEARKEK